MSDKRRKARVQGGWAGPPDSTGQGIGPRKASGTNKGHVIRSDCAKPKMPSVPAWTGKNADPQEKKKYTFQQPDQPLPTLTKVKVIEKAGVYDLSTDSKGPARIRLFPNFIEPTECKWMYEELFYELPWRQRSDVKNGVEYLQPRLTAWFGDVEYSYSGVTLQPNHQWGDLLTMIKEKLEENTGEHFNTMLANLYRDGHDHVPWHADNESQLGQCPTIASLSLGDTRTFELRRKPPEDLEDKSQYVPEEVVQVPLDAGCLLIMEGSTQENWQHRLSKEYHDRGPRINLTFRKTYPKS